MLNLTNPSQAEPKPKNSGCGSFIYYIQTSGTFMFRMGHLIKFLSPGGNLPTTHLNQSGATAGVCLWQVQV